MVKISKWLEEGKPTEAGFLSTLKEEGYTANSISEEAGTTKDPQNTDSDTSIWVFDGMARITLPDSSEEYFDLMAGDRLDIPKGAKHGLMVGPAGVKAVEGKK